MKLEPFEMERMQSQWENVVQYNLSESGVHPVTVAELVGDGELRDQLLSQRLGYSQTNGTEELRGYICRLYPGADIDNILVTNGCSEANFIVTWSMLEAGDELVFMVPNYMQIWGIARGFGATVKHFQLLEELNWAPDLDRLRQAVTSKTKMIAVCNPNNPTGAVLSEEAMEIIVEEAERVGAWLLADEVYQGAERVGKTTPSFWGRYDKVLVTNGLSKAYGLPGLRIGWIVGSKEIIARLWSYHDYTTISPGTLSDQLARIALAPGNRERFLARTRRILQTNFPILENWIEGHAATFSLIPPRAGAIAYLRYDLEINSTELVRRLLHEKSVLIVPGDHFGMDRYLRIGYGPEAEYFQAGLDRIHETLQEIEQNQP